MFVWHKVPTRVAHRIYFAAIAFTVSKTTTLLIDNTDRFDCRTRDYNNLSDPWMLAIIPAVSFISKWPYDFKGIWTRDRSKMSSSWIQRKAALSMKTNDLSINLWKPEKLPFRIAKWPIWPPIAMEGSRVDDTIRLFSNVAGHWNQVFIWIIQS